MDLGALEIFASVVKSGSFAGAARDRQVDPSLISRSVASLEQELGTRLFQRSTRRLALTEAGRVYFARMHPLLRELKQASNEAADVSSAPRGVLRVSASSSFGLKCIVPALPALARKFPDLSVELSLTDATVDLLAEQLDVAVRLGSLTDSSMVAQALMRISYVVCANPAYLAERGHPSSPSEIHAHDCLVFPLPGFRSRWIFRARNGSRTEARVTARTVISSALGLQYCALYGMGLALLPLWLVKQDLEAGALVDVFPTFDVTATDFSGGAWAVYPSRSYVPLKVRVFVEHLKGFLASL